MKNPTVFRDAFSPSEAIAAAVITLAQSNIPVDVQELLLFGDPTKNIPPRVLQKAIAACLAHLNVDAPK